MLDAHDILNLLAGFGLGLLPIVIPILVRHHRLRRSGVRGKYLGEFFLYHWSGTVSTVVRAKKLTMKLSWDGTLTAVMPADAMTNLSYSGEAVVSSGGILYLNMVGVGHGEHISAVLNSPVHSAFDLTTGVFCSVDLCGTPSAFKTILSRIELSHEQICTILGHRQVLKSLRLPTSTASDLA